MATQIVPPRPPPVPPVVRPTADPTAALASAAIEQIASGTLRLPPYPAIAAKLQRLIAEERTGTHHLTSLIGSDPVLTAMVLARASSAAMGGGPTSSLDVAIFRLGGNELVQLALASSLGVATTGKGPLSGLRRQQWRDALISAGLCEALALRRKLAPDRAFIAGLLHDFGAVVAITVLEDLAAKRATPPMAESQWHALVQSLHLEAGARVAQAWKISPEINEVIAGHHSPSATPLVRLVALVDTVVRSLGELPLEGIPGLDGNDLHDIAAALPKIMEQIGSFEQAMPAVQQAVAEPQISFKPAPGADGWPVVMQVMTPKGVYQSDMVWMDRLAFHGAVPLRPDWIAQIIVEDGVDRLDMFANVKSCEQKSPQRCDIVAAPFGLAGADAATWQRIVDRARGPRR